ncbi:carboxypeptidase regulatory-like domain-containing protein [Nitrosococcus wardiae]|uniref:Carboxypeptidase regulatory-like domain-containing protein n=1 Tax=Nitrosococcus wardiae TaxID=1814290 RepID=A0A4P7BZT1_9GAMM|nr:carboxypeptidase regulatory-like domain-containing protein [Nitrosococcus wardiae]QBQ54799.1 carboxypeptidase regulatory-like domain-containing protein [Nitrosococcus wardiae]
MLKFPINFLEGVKFFARALLLLSTPGVFVGNLWAANLQIQVVEEDKKTPLEEAAVCLGTSPNPQQFGAFLTDKKGQVLFHELQPVPLILTVSKSGFRGEQRIVGRQTLNRVMVVSLAPGGSGPTCQVPPQAKGEPPAAVELQVKALAINRGAPLTQRRKVRLSFSVEGKPTQYRASQFPDFRDAPWETFVLTPQFELSPGSGEKTVYLQVRRHREINGSHLQMVSNTIKDSIYFSER